MMYKAAIPSAVRPRERLSVLARSVEWTRRSFLCLTAAGLAACTTVPFTGRSPLRTISDDDLIPAANEHFARIMDDARRKGAIVSAQSSPRAAKQIELVSRVTGRVLEASGLTARHTWEIVLLNFGEKNAFVLPNGKIVVFAGILPVVQNEEGLATIIGHEVGHFVAQHQAERVSQQLAGNLGFEAEELRLQLAGVRFRGLVAAASGIGVHYGLLLPFRREHELEADRLGQIFMAKAGYDPVNSIAVWERIEAQSGSGPWGFLSTHPSTATRRVHLDASLPEAQRYYADQARPVVLAARSPQDSTSPRPEEHVVYPSAPRPTFLPGYSWRVQVDKRAVTSVPRYSWRVQWDDQKVQRTYRFDHIASCPARTCYVLESNDGFTSLLTPDYAIIETQRPEGASTTFSPALAYFDWPVRVGATRSGYVAVKDFTGQEQRRLIRSEVTAYESVTTKAGTFMGFRITVSANGLPFRDSWYVPELRHEAKVVQHSGLLQSTSYELLDYQHTTAPVIEPDRLP